MTNKLITNHNWGMLKGIPVINTSALDNPFCLKMSKSGKFVCSYCYSIKTTIPKSPNNIRCRNSWKRNRELLSKKILKYEELPMVIRFRQNDKLIPHLVVRLNSQGELINETHYINFINLCRKNLYTTFVLYTKRVDIISKYGKKEIPKDHHLYNRLREVDNLVLIYSQPIINKLEDRIPDHFDKVFTVLTKEFSESNNIAINCIKKCIDCRKCYGKDNGFSKIYDQIKGTKINWKEFDILLEKHNNS